MAEEATFLDGSFLTRIVLLQHRRTADAATQAAIDKALADPDFLDHQVVPLLSAKAPGGGGIAALLALIVQYLPQILALIMQFFPVTPPAKMEVATV